MTAHSKMIGGSNAKRVIHCPGSWKLGATVPRLPSSSYADEGTLLHQAMASIIDNEVAKPEDVIGMTYLEHELTPELYDEMIVPALQALEDIGLTALVSETTVEIPGLPGEFGTADTIGTCDKFTAVVDFKFGRGVYVSPTDNEQLKYYGVGAMATYPEFFDKKKPVRLYIIQPAFNVNAEPYDEISVADLTAFHLKLKQTTRLMKKRDAPFAMGDWCKWCPAETVCPLKDKLAVEALKKTGKLTPKQLGRFLKEDAPRLEELIAARRQLAYEQLSAGHEVPGMKLVQGRKGARQWADAGKAEQALRAIRKLKVGDIFKMTLLTPTQMEKMLAKKGLKMDEVDGCDTTQSPGNINMVSDDAHGESVAPMGDVFKKIASRVK